MMPSSERGSMLWSRLAGLNRETLDSGHRLLRPRWIHQITSVPSRDYEQGTVHADLGDLITEVGDHPHNPTPQVSKITCWSGAASTCFGVSIIKLLGTGWPGRTDWRNICGEQY